MDVNQQRVWVWEAIAEELGVSHGSNRLGVTGRRGDLSFEASEYVHANSAVSTIVSYPSLGYGFVVAKRRSGLFSGVRSSKWSDDEEVRTGDELFDECLQLRARDGASVLTFLTPRRRAALIEAADQHPDLVVTDVSASLMLPAWTGLSPRVLSVEEVVHRVRFLLDLADELRAETT